MTGGKDRCAPVLRSRGRVLGRCRFSPVTFLLSNFSSLARLRRALGLPRTSAIGQPQPAGVERRPDDSGKTRPAPAVGTLLCPLTGRGRSAQTPCEQEKKARGHPRRKKIARWRGPESPPLYQESGRAGACLLPNQSDGEPKGAKRENEINATDHRDTKGTKTLRARGHARGRAPTTSRPPYGHQKTKNLRNLRIEKCRRDACAPRGRRRGAGATMASEPALLVLPFTFFLLPCPDPASPRLRRARPLSLTPNPNRPPK